jgi:hypothetical protein
LFRQQGKLGCALGAFRCRELHWGDFLVDAGCG